MSRKVVTDCRHIGHERCDSVWSGNERVGTRYFAGMWLLVILVQTCLLRVPVSGTTQDDSGGVLRNVSAHAATEPTFVGSNATGFDTISSGNGSSIAADESDEEEELADDKFDDFDDSDGELTSYATSLAHKHDPKPGEDKRACFWGMFPMMGGGGGGNNGGGGGNNGGGGDYVYEEEEVEEEKRRRRRMQQMRKKQKKAKAKAKAKMRKKII